MQMGREGYGRGGVRATRWGEHFVCGVDCAHLDGHVLLPPREDVLLVQLLHDDEEVADGGVAK